LGDGVSQEHCIILMGICNHNHSITT